MLKYEIIDLPIISIIGKEGLCTKEKNVVQDLWQQANSNFSDIADLETISNAKRLGHSGMSLRRSMAG